MTRIAAGLLAALTWAGAQPLPVPSFKQQKNGCGAASVAMVMHYWSARLPGAPASPQPAEVYRRLYDEQLRGIPLARMKRYLENSGFLAYTFHGRWSDIEQQLGKGRPVIVSLKKRPSSAMHYAVVTGILADRILLNDPSKRGGQSMKRPAFEKQWSQADGWMLLAAPRE